MTSFLHENGITSVEPMAVGMWGIPTAICALIIHLFRLSRLDARIALEIHAHMMKQSAIETGAV